MPIWGSVPGTRVSAGVRGAPRGGEGTYADLGGAGVVGLPGDGEVAVEVGGYGGVELLAAAGGVGGGLGRLDAAGRGEDLASDVEVAFGVCVFVPDDDGVARGAHGDVGLLVGAAGAVGLHFVRFGSRGVEAGDADGGGGGALLVFEDDREARAVGVGGDMRVALLTVGVGVGGGGNSDSAGGVHGADGYVVEAVAVRVLGPDDDRGAVLAQRHVRLYVPPVAGAARRQLLLVDRDAVPVQPQEHVAVHRVRGVGGVAVVLPDDGGVAGTHRRERGVVLVAGGHAVRGGPGDVVDCRAGGEGRGRGQHAAHSQERGHGGEGALSRDAGTHGGGTHRLLLVGAHGD